MTRLTAIISAIQTNTSIAEPSSYIIRSAEISWRLFSVMSSYSELRWLYSKEIKMINIIFSFCRQILLNPANWSFKKTQAQKKHKEKKLF